MRAPVVLAQSKLVLANTAVRLEFPASVLVRLLARGYLHAAEFRCLDLASQVQVRRALLKSCIESLNKESCHEENL
ncbi:MAG: hypothetical protein N3A55_00660 [Methylohalobius sp.]|nr:hypothetical protein [Methylohalobius sp.]